MASAEESAYFPSLDTCLSNRVQLLSWRTIYNSLIERKNCDPGSSLRQQLEDPQAQELLQGVLQSSPKPDTSTRRAFEAKTSAINIAPTSQSNYDLAEIKDDASWLSKEAETNEVVSLRIAVLEWQDRPAKRLAEAVASDDSAGQLKARNYASLQTSVRFSNLSQSQSTTTKGNGHFSSSFQRRKRLLEAYLFEREYLLATASLLISIPPDEFMEDLATPTWLRELGQNIRQTWRLNDEGAEKSNTSWLFEITKHVRWIVDRLKQGCRWNEFEDSDQDPLDSIWTKSLACQLTHVLTILYGISDSTTGMAVAEHVTGWFLFMQEVGFFDDLELKCENSPEHTAQIRLLTSIASLAILKLSNALDVIPELASAAIAGGDKEAKQAYIRSTSAVEAISNVLIRATEEGSNVASPSVLAWAITLQTMRAIAEATKESRETRLSQKAIDSFAVESDNDSADGTGSTRRVSPHRRSSIASDSSQQATLLEEMLETVLHLVPNVDIIHAMASGAVDGCKVFALVSYLSIGISTRFSDAEFGYVASRMRLSLLDLIRAAIPGVGYQSDIIQALDDLLRPIKPEALTNDVSAGFHTALSSAILNDVFLMQSVFDEALSRFPFEAIPFLRLCRGLSTSYRIEERAALKAVLEHIPTFTCLLEDERIYQLGLDDPSIVELTDMMNVLPRSGLLTDGRVLPSTDRSLELRKRPGGLFIPVGTHGTSLSEGKPLVVQWQYSYSCLQYIGLMLYQSLSSRSSHIGPNIDPHADYVSEMIGLLASLLGSTTDSPGSQPSTELARGFLEEASDGLDRNQDIITVVFGILEAELNKSQPNSPWDQSIDILIECTNFMGAVLLIMPGRVWPFLGRCSLLGLDGTMGRLVAVISSTEVTAGNYDFLFSNITVLERLISDSITNVVARRSYAAASSRFEKQDLDSVGSGITDTAMSKILLQFTRIALDVFQSTHIWKFQNPADRMKINGRLCTIFYDILKYAYGCDETEDDQKFKKTTFALQAAADYLMAAFTSSTANESLSQSLVDLLVETTMSSTKSMGALQMYHSKVQTRMVVKFTLFLLKITIASNAPESQLREKLLGAVPSLAKLFALSDTNRQDVIELFHTLVLSLALDNTQEPILAKLGSDAASDFLELLLRTCNSDADSDLSTAVWELSNSVVRERQQWLAISLLTGSPPRSSLKRDGCTGFNAAKKPSLLKIALEKLTHLAKLPYGEGVQLLQFVASAADFWPWVLADIEANEDLLGSLMRFLHDLEHPQSSIDLEVYEKDIKQIRMGAYVVDILALVVNRDQKNGSTNVVLHIAANLQYLLKHGVANPGYNASLHTALGKNIEKKFAGCRISSFKKTALQERPLGSHFYYDLDLAGQVLGHDPAWLGTGKNGFREEFKRANLNLSLVEAHVTLFHSWRTLAIEVAESVAFDQRFAKSIVKVVLDSLQANIDNTLPELIFDRLAQARADLAFSLTQILVTRAKSQKEARKILAMALSALRMHAPELSTSLTGDEAEYTRVLLKTIYLALESHLVPIPPKDVTSREEERQAVKDIQTVLEVLGKVVAGGFRSLTTLLHDEDSSVLPADFALLTAILRSCLKVPKIEWHTEALVALFSDDNTARYATTLLSWSDQIVVDGDPVYTELSLSFLLELSTVPALAESLALDGILSQIAATSILNFYRYEHGKGPFDQPLCMYETWSRRILSLCVNLLTTIGAPLAVEVGTFINQFKPQLDRASNHFDTKPTMAPLSAAAGYVTLSMAMEAQSLAVIATILNIFREAGASAGIKSSDVPSLAWDRAAVKEDLEARLSRRSALRENIVPTNAREEEWSRLQPTDDKSGAENRLEEKVVAEMTAALRLLGEYGI